MPAVSERILLALGVCLPVPLLAATGLSIPLPATVERLAASLVPFAEAAPVEAARAPRGVVVRTPTEAQKTEVRRRLVARKGGTGTRPTRATKPALETNPKRGQPIKKSPAPVPAKGAPTPPPETPQPQPSPAPQPVAQPQPEAQPEPQPQPQQTPTPPPPPPPPAPIPPPPPPPVLPPAPPLPLPIPLPPPPLPLPLIGK